MKKFKFLIVAVLVFTLALCGCGGTGDNSGGGHDDGNGGEKLEIEAGDKNNPTYMFVEDGELTASTVSKNDSIYKLQATDDYGRSVDYICGYKTDKKRYVGLMYFLWLGYHGSEMPEVYDISKLLDDDPDALWNTDGAPSSPLGKYHHWGEPLYGYYNSKDPWVIRKQIELFIMSGIDFLCFDCTNGFEYIEAVEVLLPIMQEYKDAGWAVPQFMFYTNSDSAGIVKRIYSGAPSATHDPIIEKGLYKGGYYRDLWFAPNGKPKIAAIINPNHNWSESNHDNSVITDPEILNFFDFWESQWPNAGTVVPNGLPWMDWTTAPGGGKGEQTVHKTADAINVSVAQHNRLPFSDALLSSDLADIMWGRGYSRKTGPDHSDDAIDSGVNFNEEWEVAIEKDCGYTLVTGWNEWVAIKSAAALGMNVQYVGSGKRVYFVDTVNREYSRDIEMMRGGYADNFYLSLMRNARTYKGSTATALAASAKGKIDVAKGLTQWNVVADVYYGLKSVKRDYVDYSGKKRLTDGSLRNDIAEIRVTHDDDNIYFLVQCFDDIVIAPEDGSWMNLLIDVDGYKNDTDFHGYDFIVNHKSSYSGQCGVEKLKYADDALSYELAGIANFSVKGKYMQYRVPKKALGISGGFTIRFKVADHVQDNDDIQSYYISGDCAPVGRLNYTFKG